MATYYITKAGSDSNDGSSGSPFLTIQHALDQTNNSDTVIVNDSGVYKENNLNRVKTGLTLKAGTGFSPIIDGTTAVEDAHATICIKAFTDWVIEGFTIRNYTDNGITGNGGQRLYTVRNCTIYDISPGDGIDGLKDSSLIDRCTIYNITGTSGAGAGIDGATRSITVKNTLIYEVTRGRGITTTGGSTVIRNCTVDSCGSDNGTTYGIFASAGTVEYTIVTNTNSSIAGLRASTHTYNCAYNNSGSEIYSGVGTGDITTNPLYTDIDEDVRNYTIQATSPCITPGASSSIGLDLTGYERGWTFNHKIDDVSTMTNHDMGCYEEIIPNINGVKTDDVANVMGIGS